MLNSHKLGVCRGTGVLCGRVLACLLFLIVPVYAGEIEVTAALESDGAVLVSTPKARLLPGMEAVRRAAVDIEGRSYIFPLKSSASKEKGKTYYEVAVSLEKSGKDNYLNSRKGVIEKDKPLNLSIEKDGRTYAAVVRFSET